MSTPSIDYDSVRYTQETFKPYFSSSRENGMSISETYVLLANGFLDPSSLAPMTIFEHDDYLYCIDTRRLKIAKELERKGKRDISQLLPIQYVKKGDPHFASQYHDLVNKRLPAMKKKGLNGSTITLDEEPSYMCCYKPNSAQFHDDLEEHIAHDHLEMDVSEFRKLNISQCDQCNQKSTIIIHKPAHKSYRFIQEHVCSHVERQIVHIMEKPWPDVSLQEISDLFRQLNNRNVIHKSIAPMKLFSSSISCDSSCSHNHYFKQDEGTDDSFIKKLRAFLLRFLLVVIVAWLTYLFLPERSTSK